MSVVVPKLSHESTSFPFDRCWGIMREKYSVSKACLFNRLLKKTGAMSVVWGPAPHSETVYSSYWKLMHSWSFTFKKLHFCVYTHEKAKGGCLMELEL